MPTVLIVEDEESTAFALRELLLSEGVQVMTTGIPARAESLLASCPVTVLLTDIRLAGTGDTSGIELLRYIRDHRLQTRSIVITGYGAPEVLQAAFDLGASYYFEKPVDLSVLSSALEALGVPCDLTGRRVP